MRPQSIVRFEQFYIAKIVLGVITTVWGMNGIRQAPLIATVGMAPQMVIGALLFGLVAGLAIELALLHFVVRRGSDFARWIIVLFFAISCCSVIYGVAKGTLFGLASYPVTLLGFALHAASVWFLFRPDASRWIKAKGAPSASHNRRS